MWITIAIPSTTPRQVTSHGRSPPRAVRSTTRCHSASVSGGISGSTVFTAAVPMTNAAGPGPIGDGDASLTAYELVPRPVQRGMPCLRTIEGHMGRIPESIWGSAPYCSGRGGGLSRGPGTARPGPTGRAVAAGAAHVRRWDGRPRVLLFQVFATCAWTRIWRGRTPQWPSLTTGVRWTWMVFASSGTSRFPRRKAAQRSTAAR